MVKHRSPKARFQVRVLVGPPSRVSLLETKGKKACNSEEVQASVNGAVSEQKLQLHDVLVFAQADNVFIVLLFEQES